MTSQLAYLGMYDGGELASANDTWWSAIAERLIARGIPNVPPSLARDLPMDAIYGDRLLFGQTCGYPFASRLSDRVQLVGVPVYDVPGCEGIHHRSFIVVHADSKVQRLEELEGTRAVLNEVESNTGHNLFGDALVSAGARAPFFASVAVSGSHWNSLLAVAHGAADVAAIDCVSYAHFLRQSPDGIGRTRILSETRSSPNLPLVTAHANDAALLLRAARDALDSERVQAARSILRLVSIEFASSERYAITHDLAARAQSIFGRSAAFSA